MLSIKYKDILTLYLYLKTALWVANPTDAEQRLYPAASDFGLHCLHRTIYE